MYRGWKSIKPYDSVEPFTTYPPKCTCWCQSRVREILTVQPEGPLFLGGFCFGGLVAFEMAQQLQRQGYRTVLPVLFETDRHPTSLSIAPFLHYKVECLRLFAEVHLRTLLRRSPKEMAMYLWEGGQKRDKRRLLRINTFAKMDMRHGG